MCVIFTVRKVYDAYTYVCPLMSSEPKNDGDATLIFLMNSTGNNNYLIRLSAIKVYYNIVHARVTAVIITLLSPRRLRIIYT